MRSNFVLVRVLQQSFNMTPFHSANHQTFSSFYDVYAPKLWGIVVLANLPVAESETILINTLAKAWRQFGQGILNEKHIFTHLIILAHKEGLPVDYLKAMPRFNQSRNI